MSSFGIPSPSSENGSIPNDEAALYGPPSPGGGTSPWALLKILWKGKWLILGLALLFAGGSYLYWHHQADQYRTASILLLNESENLDQLDLSLPVEQPNKTARHLYFLRHSQTFAETVTERLADSLGTTAAQAGPPLEASQIRGSVRVRQGSQQIPAIKFSMTSSDPRRAAQITNTYAQTYRDHLRESSNARLHASRQFLLRQKKRLKGRLRALEDTIAAHVRAQGRAGLLTGPDSTGGAGISGEARQIAGDISDLRVQKEKVQLKLDIENRMLDSTKARLKRIRPNLAGRASSTTADRLQGLQKNIASLQSQIQQITLQNESLKPKLRAELAQKKARVDSLRKKSKRLADQYVHEALSTDAVQPLGNGGKGLSSVVDLRRKMTDHRITLTKLKARRSALTDRIEARQDALRQSPDQTLARLERRKNTTEELFVSLSKSLQKVQVSSKSTPPQAQILQWAKPPSTPIGPNVKNNVLLALLLGGTLGAGIVFLYNRTSNRIEKPEDIQQLDIGLFGVVPSWSRDEATDPSGREEEPGMTSRPWSNVAAPCSPSAEAYRHITTNLQLGVPECPDRLLITSPHPEEGKTTTTANLGVALCEAGQDVLLVEADVYGPSLHRELGYDRESGLTDALAADAGVVRAVRSPSEKETTVSGDGAPTVAETLDGSYCPEMGRLGLLPAGTKVPQPSLLLKESPLRTLFEGLQSDWDVLLIDSPPLLAYDAASQLAALSDMALVIADAGATSGDGYAEAIDRTETLCPGPVAGVLNRYDVSPSDIYGYAQTTYASASAHSSLTGQFVQRTKRGFHHLVKGL